MLQSLPTHLLEPKVAGTTRGIPLLYMPRKRADGSESRRNPMGQISLQRRKYISLKYLKYWA